MNTFKLTQPARHYLQSRCAASDLQNPVVMLQYDLGDLSPDSATAQALRRGATLEEVKAKYVEESADRANETKRLVPALFPKSDVPSDDLFVVDGVEFCMPQALVAHLSKFALDLGPDNQLYFVNEHGERYEY